MKKTPRIACLHTAHSNIAVFDEAGLALGLPAGTLTHTVRPEFLAAAESAGYLPPEISDQSQALLLALLEEADAVVSTCSTLGPAVEALSPQVQARVLRVDAALAQAAVKQGGHVAVLCAVQTTVAPTTALFEAAARQTGAVPVVEVVPQAWALFKQGDLAGYTSLIATAVKAAYAGGADSVALAQSSMAPAATLVFESGTLPADKHGTLFTSPGAGLAAALVAALQPRTSTV